MARKGSRIARSSAAASALQGGGGGRVCRGQRQHTAELFGREAAEQEGGKPGVDGGGGGVVRALGVELAEVQEQGSQGCVVPDGVPQGIDDVCEAALHEGGRACDGRRSRVYFAGEMEGIVERRVLAAAAALAVVAAGGLWQVTTSAVTCDM